jgi:4-hydroxyphenylpyruvate dioxygenase
MVTGDALGIKRIESIHYYVHDLERSRRFYTQKLGFSELAHSSPDLEARGHQRSVAFLAGDCCIGVSQPLGEGGRAWRYLRKHAEGVGTIIFEVENAEHAFELLERRGATAINDVQRHESNEHGALAFFSITTPFGDTTFRFVERKEPGYLFPGWIARDTPLDKNDLGIQSIDHVTSNFQTMMPALLWLEHVLGFERYWSIEFHTDDLSPSAHGSGLRSVVMWEPGSGIKFANNEPYRPHFKQSQINIFHEENRGDGVQHVALHVASIIDAVRGMRARGVDFMPTPDAYYDNLKSRLEKLHIGTIDESVDELRELGILVDGCETHRYLLQIFLKESASVHADPEAGPFFFELIERKGDAGFGGGNFRALFESIEAAQRSEGSDK